MNLVMMLAAVRSWATSTEIAHPELTPPMNTAMASFAFGRLPKLSFWNMRGLQSLDHSCAQGCSVPFRSVTFRNAEGAFQAMLYVLQLEDNCNSDGESVAKNRSKNPLPIKARTIRHFELSIAPCCSCRYHELVNSGDWRRGLKERTHDEVRGMSATLKSPAVTFATSALGWMFDSETRSIEILETCPPVLTAEWRRCVHTEETVGNDRSTGSGLLWLRKQLDGNEGGLMRSPHAKCPYAACCCVRTGHVFNCSSAFGSEANGRN
eukprot:4635160-Amphidinium_carterae.2